MIDTCLHPQCDWMEKPRIQSSEGGACSSNRDFFLSFFKVVVYVWMVARNIFPGYPISKYKKNHHLPIPIPATLLHVATVFTPHHVDLEKGFWRKTLFLSLLRQQMLLCLNQKRIKYAFEIAFLPPCLFFTSKWIWKCVILNQQFNFTPL